VVVLLVLSLVFKRDFLGLLGGGEGPAGATSGEVTSSPEEEKLVDFVSFVLDDAQATWDRLLPAQDDLGFYDELRRRFGAPGDFAQAYVLAHEIGHHVQRLLGTEERVRETQRRRPELANPLSVRLELQADCYAGIWANSTARRDLLEQGDTEEAMSAAAAVGDDRIQRMGGGTVHPEAFTHGSAEERTHWFQEGFGSGRLEACDTFRER
jgi:hypothetical protein